MEHLAEIKVTEEDTKKIIDFINKQRGLDLSSYRENFFLRRLRVRMLATKIEEVKDYIRLIQNSPEEFNLFLDALSINVTEFFRDIDVFDAFAKFVVPEVIKRKEASGNKVIRIWSAACAYGQEPYSLAILMKEALGDRKDFLVKILGTDIDEEALTKADQGIYACGDFKKVRKDIIEKYFVSADNNNYRVCDEIRRMVKFEKFNLIKDPPLKFMDIIFCRNVMIYFSHQQQDELFRKFAQALHSNGYLVIGKVEATWSRDLFIPVRPMQKIYQRVN